MFNKKSESSIEKLTNLTKELDYLNHQLCKVKKLPEDSNLSLDSIYFYPSDSPTVVKRILSFSEGVIEDRINELKDCINRLLK